MVECTQQELCATRWFHLPCTGLLPGKDVTQWTCAECVAGIVMKQDCQEDLERRRVNGEVAEDEDEVIVQQEQEKATEKPRKDSGVVGDEGDEDELEQQEYVSDGVPGVFFGAEEDELPRPVASPLKRKSDEVDTPPRKKTKRASPSPSPAPAPGPEPEYCVCGTPADNDMIACDAPKCHAEWFHYVCVGLTAATIPPGKWFCDECTEIMEKARKEKKKKGGKEKGKRKR